MLGCGLRPYPNIYRSSSRGWPFFSRDIKVTKIARFQDRIIRECGYESNWSSYARLPESYNNLGESFIVTIQLCLKDDSKESA